MNTRFTMSVTARPAPLMQRGKGSFLWDDQGRRYLDFIQGWAVNALGHCPPEIITALEQQSRLLITPSPALHNAPQHLLAQELSSLSGLGKVNLSNSGAEANEAAIKLARKWGQKHKSGAARILSCNNSFHGRTLATMAASGKAGWDRLFPPVMPGFDKVPFGDIVAMRDAVTDDTVAIMVEPIQGEAGVILPPAGYLPALRTLADEHHLLLILDEVQTGIGRTGEFFAFMHEGISADIMTLGKGLGGGVPIAAMLAREAVCVFEAGDQGGTYGGNPLMSAVALAVVQRVCTPAQMQRVHQAGELLQHELAHLGERFALRDIRGAGLLWAVDLDQDIAQAVQAQAMELGLLVNAARPQTLRLMPALTVTDDEIRLAIELLARALQRLQ